MKSLVVTLRQCRPELQVIKKGHKPLATRAATLQRKIKLDQLNTIIAFFVEVLMITHTHGNIQLYKVMQTTSTYKIYKRSQSTEPKLMQMYANA